ncbi:FtsX-like permease family protein [Proteiniborus sp.]|uniref:ABC transporter permease n=1 Tax=Proteiniborus sp. TaxID=2079015 RepID=UPI003319A4B8
MKIKDIAKTGLKGRKKDTFLLKLVITLAFIFIVTSTIFEASIDKTKLEQRSDLYGQWHAAYLNGDEEILNRLRKEQEVDKTGVSLIIGESNNCGVVGTFNQDLIDMGRFSLYKGSYPKAPNEIMLELNQMSNMNLDLEVGQKVQVAISIQTVDGSMKDYIKILNKEFTDKFDKEIEEVNLLELDWLIGNYEKYIGELPTDEKEAEDELRKLYSNYYFGNAVQHHRHHETPFEQIGDVTVVGSNDYLYYYFMGDEMSPEIIRKKGLLRSQKIILKKEFIITGILQTYTDKWDLGGHKAANAFITEEGAKAFTEAFYNTTIGDFSDYEMSYNIFLHSNSSKENLYSKLAIKYPNREEALENEEPNVEIDEWSGRYLFGDTDEEIDAAFERAENWGVSRKLEDWREDYLEGKGSSENKMEINTDNFRRNRFSYPSDSLSTEYVLTLTIIAIIFIATALAIFQIFLTQMKRRARKIVLLKSIGATNGQIIKIILFEGLYLLRTGLLIGIPGGFGLAVIIIYGMNIFGGRNLQFYIIPKLLVLGILACCLALFIGMSIPMIFAIRIPLVGTMSKPPKHKKIKHKSNNKGKIRRQTFGYINWRYFKLNKGKTFISFGISFITITIILSTILLCYLSFDNYKTTVLYNKRPDYALETYYGDTSRGIKAVEENLKEIDGIKSTEVYKVGKQTFLWYDGIEENILLRTYEQLLPQRLLAGHFSSYNKDLENEPEWIKNAFYTRTYGIDPDSELFSRFSLSVTKGAVNKERFSKGKEIILLVPMYLSRDANINKKRFSDDEVIFATNEGNRMRWLFDRSDTYKITYNSRYSKYYDVQEDIKPGDIIYLSSDDEKIVGDSYVVSHTTKEVKVGGVIHYFPKEGMWPFSDSTAPYIVVSSINGMESVYPSSRFGLYPNTLEERKSAVNALYPTKYGRTLWYINTDTKEQDVILNSKLLAYANNNGYTVYNYKESNSKLYQEAFNNALIIGLLGLTAAAIAFIILYNTMVSKMEQDRNRIGILQSFGVTNAQFSRHYLQVGIINGFISVLVVNILLVIVLFITSIGATEGITMTIGDHIKDIFAYRLWLYPWVAHVGICIVFFILTVLIYYLPSRNITKQYPVENIRSLGR